MARKTKEDSDKTKQAILDAAESVFLARGVSATSMADIAKYSGISRGAIYGHYANKIELAIAMCNRAFHFVGSWLPETQAPYIPFFYATTLSIFKNYDQSNSIYKTIEILFVKCEHNEENTPLLKRRNYIVNKSRQWRRRILRAARNNGELPPETDLIATDYFLQSLFDGIYQNLIWLQSPQDIDWPMVERLLQTGFWSIQQRTV